MNQRFFGRFFGVITGLFLVAIWSCSPSGEVDFENCERIDFQQSFGSARVSDNSLLFKAKDTRGDSDLSLLVESWFAAGGPTQAGQVIFPDNVNYQTCPFCITLETGCTDNGCERLFLATAGNVTLQKVADQVGRPVGIRLNEILFEQITLDDESVSTVVPDSAALCVEGVGLSALASQTDEPVTRQVEATEPEPACVQNGTGKGIGDNIANFSLSNCLGETVDFHTSCGAHKALWLVTTAGWCVACESWIPQVQAEVERLADAGVGVYHFLGADLNFDVPSLEYCASYAESKGLDPSRVIVDANWDTLYNHLDHYDYNFTPINFVLDGSNLAYLWSDAANDGELTSLVDAIDSLLD